jgi:hypothetical protein
MLEGRRFLVLVLEAIVVGRKFEGCCNSRSNRAGFTLGDKDDL